MAHIIKLPLAVATELHNRTLLRDLKVTYTNPLKNYLKRIGCDYEPNKLCL